MAMKTSKRRKAMKKDFLAFDEPLYSKITLNDLIVYAVAELSKQNIEITADDIVFACFHLFPQKFALKKYPRLPDSSVVSRHWRICRSRGIISAREAGLKLTAKGERLAGKIAKALGVEIPKKKPAAPKKVKAEKKSPKKIAAPVEKPIEKPGVKTTPKKVKAQKITPRKTAALVEKPIEKSKVKPAPKKKKPVVETKIEVLQTKPVEVKTRKAEKKPPVPVMAEIKQPELPLVTPSAAQVKSAPQKRKAQPKPIWREKIIPPSPIAPVAEKSAPIEAEKPSAPVSVSPEAKIRAGKFIRMMEDSDAYIQYKKNGVKANISEFDFRSLLLCTMESSAETLARNVEQFKGYAEIHKRNDLIRFLEFCGETFSYLLVPQKKTAKKRQS